MLKGEVAYLYAFDVAHEIDTSKVRRVLSRKAVTLEFELHKSRPRELSFSKPLEIVPNLSKLKFNGQTVQTIVRIYEVGAISVSIRVPFEVKSLGELVAFHNLKFENDKKVDQVAKNLCLKARDNIRDALVRPTEEIAEPEAYTVFCLRELEKKKTSDEFLNEFRSEIVGLLTETEPEDLSPALVKELTSAVQSFEKADLVVIDWDAAFVIELGGYLDDTLYALEAANLQLEEIKVLDALIDKQLDQSYHDLRKGSSLFNPQNIVTLKRLREVRIDVIRLKDEISNTAKFFGDWYLARVYMTAREKFKILEWQKSVEDKLSHLNQLYSVISSDNTNRKMIWLEAMIVILFILDLIGVFFIE